MTSSKSKINVNSPTYPEHWWEEEHRVVFPSKIE